MKQRVAPRIACCRVSDLPLAAELRASPELSGRPVAVAAGPGPRAEIAAVSPQAEARGVRRLMSAAHARSICAELCVRVASPALERTARAALLDAALSLAPRAARAPRVAGVWAGEACVCADASGIAALFHGEEGFAAALAARAERLGLPASVAVAASPGVARIAARRLGPGEVRVLPPGSEAAFLAPLPLELLDPEDATLAALARFGVHCVRDLLRLPPRALGARLGPHVLDLVARARGEAREPPLPPPPPPQPVEATDFELGVDRLEPLGFALQGLLSRLLVRLEARHLACGGLALRLDLEGGGCDARRLGLGAPTSDLRVLMRLLVHALEAHPPAAAVVGACLEAEAEPLRSDQLDLFRPAGPAPAALGRTLAELQDLCGEERIGSPRPADDHRPGRFELSPFHPPAAPPPTLHTGVCLSVRALRPPAPAEVRLRGGCPAWIRSAVANGRVVHAAGPWRTTGGWWSREGRYAYDSYDVETEDGTLARLRRDHVRGRWDIDAVYD